MWNKKNFAVLEDEISKYLSTRLTKGDIEKIKKFMKESSDMLDSDYSRVLVHQDIYDRNIIISDNKLAGIIDFNQPSIADPAQDFEGLCEFETDFVNGVYEQYNGPKDDNFLNRSYLYYQRMALWNMVGSFDGYTGSYDEGYKMFRERF